MRTNFILSYVIFVFFSLTSNAQQNKVEIEYYQAITNKDITKTDKPKILRDLDYVLQFTNTESVFYNIPRMETEGFRSNRRYVTKSGASGVFYKNLKPKEKFHSVNVLGKDFLIKSDLDDSNWILTKDTKKIDKYMCYKAYYELTNPQIPGISVTITAWYTIELPFPFGPLGYDGLPGVVLELDILDYAFVAKKITFNNNFKINKPKGEIVTNQVVLKYFQEKTGINIEEKLKDGAKKEVNKRN